MKLDKSLNITERDPIAHLAFHCCLKISLDDTGKEERETRTSFLQEQP